MLDKEKNFVSAVIYVHNAENRIEDFLKMVISVLENNFEYSEVICVNDSSEDNSLAEIRRVSKIVTSANVSVIHMGYFHGLEVAMDAGMDLAIGDFVFEFDSTVLDFGMAEVMGIYQRALQGYDIVSAVPDRKETLTSKLFYRVFDRYTNLSYGMHTESFRILSRRAINRVASMSRAVPYRKAIYASAGLETDMVMYQPNRSFVAKIDKKEQGYRARLAMDSLVLFTEVGYRLAMGMTAFMMLVSIFMVAYSVIVYVTANPVAGWTTTVLFFSIAFSGLFGILTIVVKYIQLLTSLVFRRKNYSFKNIEKLTKQ